MDGKVVYFPPNSAFFNFDAFSERMPRHGERSGMQGCHLLLP